MIAIGVLIISTIVTVIGFRIYQKKRKELADTKMELDDTKTELIDEKNAWLIDWKKIHQKGLISKKGAFGEVYRCEYNLKECVVKILKMKKVIMNAILQLCLVSASHSCPLVSGGFR